MVRRWVFSFLLVLIIFSFHANTAWACDPWSDPDCPANCGVQGCQPTQGEDCNICPEDCGCTLPDVCTDSGGVYICETPNPCVINGQCNIQGGETCNNCGDDCCDYDSDGVRNDLDACPNTPWAERNYVNADGCSCSQINCGSYNCNQLDTTCRDYSGTVPYDCSYGICSSSHVSCTTYTDTPASPPTSCSPPTGGVCDGAGSCVDGANHAPVITSYSITSAGMVVDGSNSIVKNNTDITLAATATDQDDDLGQKQIIVREGLTTIASTTKTQCSADDTCTDTLTFQATTSTLTGTAKFWDDNDNLAAQSKSIIVEEPPTNVALTSNDTTPRTDQDIKFTIAATDTNLKDYKITYGNGADSGWIACTTSSCDQTYRYTNAGTYTPSVERRDARNWITSATGPSITVTEPNPAPVVNSVSFSPASPTSGEAVTISIAFTDDNPTHKRVDLGNGTTTAWSTCTSNPCSVNIVFRTGSYSITGKIKDAAGNIGTKTATLTVADNPVPDVYSVTFTPTNPIAGQAVTIKAYFTDPDSPFQKQFEVDGTVHGWEDCAANPCTDTRAFPTGQHTIIARVKDSQDGVGEKTETLTVDADPAPVLGVPSFTPSSPQAGETVAFTITASDNDVVSLLQLNKSMTTIAQKTNCGQSCTWNPTYVFTGAGTKSMTALAVDNVGGKRLRSFTIIIVDNPPAVTDPTASPDAGYIGETEFTFSATATDTNLKEMRWIFGDGTSTAWSACSSSPCTKTTTHTYAAMPTTGNTYTVQVQANDTNNHVTTKSVTVEVCDRLCDVRSCGGDGCGGFCGDGDPLQGCGSDICTVGYTGCRPICETKCYAPANIPTYMEADSTKACDANGDGLEDAGMTCVKCKTGSTPPLIWNSDIGTGGDCTCDGSCSSGTCMPEFYPGVCAMCTEASQCTNPPDGDVDCTSAVCDNGQCEYPVNTGMQDHKCHPDNEPSTPGICAGTNCIPTTIALEAPQPIYAGQPPVLRVTLNNIDNDWTVNVVHTGSGNGVSGNCRESGNTCTADITSTVPAACPSVIYYASATQGEMRGDDDAVQIGDTTFSITPSDEICDGIDNNCVNGVDEGCDDDKDGYADAGITCSGNFRDGNGQMQSCSTHWNDCDDDPASEPVSGAAIHPDAVEICDTVDNDCDSSSTPEPQRIDEGCDDDADLYYDDTMICVGGFTTWSDTGGSNNDCTGRADCDDEDNSVNPERAEICNDKDDNCGAGSNSVSVDEGCDKDDDDYCDEGMTVVGPPDTCLSTTLQTGAEDSVGDDCNDNNAQINPGMAELCDGANNNCVDGTDEGCICNSGETQQCFEGTGEPDVGACKSGIQTCNLVGVWGSCVGNVSAADEVCNGIDDNCDDDVDNPPDGESLCQGNLTCRETDDPDDEPGTKACQCEPGYGRIAGTEDTCAILQWWYRDQDGDGAGDPDHKYPTQEPEAPSSEDTDFINNSQDCDDTNALISPFLIENCVDGFDNNCDGLVDTQDTVVCTQFGCPPGSALICGQNSYTDTILRRKSQTCVMELVTRNVNNHTPSCAEPFSGNAYCSYQQQITETAWEDSGYVEENTACVGTTDGFCDDEGTCLEPCPYIADEPGCWLGSNPPEEALREGYGCERSGDGQVQYCYRCPDSMIWDESKDTCTDTPYTIILDTVITTANNQVVLTPKTIDHRGREETVLYEFTGFRRGETDTEFIINTAFSEVGQHDLTVQATKYGLFGKEEIIAKKTIEVIITCPADEACCPEGEPFFEDEGTECMTQGIFGECTIKGKCQPTCEEGATPEHSNRNNCNDGIDNDCNGVYDCVKNEFGQYEDHCTKFCGGTFCVENEIICSNGCSNTQEDRLNCGACGNACESNEQCIEGWCTQMEDCFVACERDRDCGTDGVCINKGQCDAYCADEPTIQLALEEQMALLQQMMKIKTYDVKKSISGSTLELFITNLIDQPLLNLTLTITIPKTFTSNPSDISSDDEFSVVGETEEIITLQTTIEQLESTAMLRFHFPQALDPAYLKFVQVAGQPSLIDTRNSNPLGTEDLIITRLFEEGADGTTVRLKLKPGATLKNVRIPLEIPKCLANSMSEIAFEKDNYIIVEDDPLMVWTFDTLSSEQEIAFSIPKNVDKDCKEQLRAFGLAGGKKKPISPWLPLAIIPIIGVVLLFFQRFHEGGAEKHLSKVEFYDLARQQGQSDEQIERSWHEYKRKF